MFNSAFKFSKRKHAPRRRHVRFCKRFAKTHFTLYNLDTKLKLLHQVTAQKQLLATGIRFISVFLCNFFWRPLAGNILYWYWKLQRRWIFYLIAVRILPGVDLKQSQGSPTYQLSLRRSSVHYSRWKTWRTCATLPNSRQTEVTEASSGTGTFPHQ